jgi:thiol-disulfide isomerase/thioredoxin
MTERLLITLALGAGFVVALAVARVWLRRRDRRVIARVRAAVPAASAGTASGAPRLVYFTTQSCVICRAQQEPAIQRLREHLTDLHVERHDAVAEHELAGAYGVLSVPTTAVFNRAGELVTINRGFVPAAVLFAQLEGREPAFEGGLPALSEPVAR